MSRAQYLASYVVSRFVLLTIEAVVLIGASVLLFKIPMRSSGLSIAAIVVISALAFGGLGLLIASRSQTIEGVSGLMNLCMLPMWVLSGVFFSAQRFPAMVQPVIRLLPLTAYIDAMRGVMLQGASLALFGREILTLVVWLVVSFVLALKLFRWR